MYDHQIKHNDTKFVFQNRTALSFFFIYQFQENKNKTKKLFRHQGQHQDIYNTHLIMYLVGTHFVYFFLFIHFIFGNKIPILR